MILWPSIDILGGKAVRLARGEFGTETTYDADPLDAARRWLQDGARALHVVDLDGARSGEPVNIEHLERIAAALKGTFAYSGGVASLEDLERLVGLRQVNLTGVVVGKALYEGRFSVAAGQALLTRGAHSSPA